MNSLFLWRWISGEIFGPTSIVALYGISCIAPAISPLVLGVITGELYDRNSDADHNCYGTKCFFYMFVIAGSGLVVALVAGIVLLRRLIHRTKAKAALGDDSSAAF